VRAGRPLERAPHNEVIGADNRLLSDGVNNNTFDADGNLATLTDPDNNTTSYSYDALDRETGQSETVALYLDGSTPVTTTATASDQYDANGNVTRAIDADGRVISDQYDALNRNTAEEWYDNTSDANAETGATNSETFSYDLDSAVVSAADDSSSYTYTYYSATGQLQTLDNNGVNAAVSGGVPDVVLTYGYNDAGQVFAESATIDGTADFKNAYSYNTNHQLETITQAGAEDGNAVADKRIDFTYTTAGEVYTVKRYSDLTGSSGDLVATSTDAYDALGRLNGLEHGNSDGSTIYEDYTWTYYASSQVHTVSNSEHSAEDATYSYDGDGQLAGSYDANGNPNGAGYVIGAGNRPLSDGTYTYTYDAAGDMTAQINISTGAETDYVYDDAGRTIGIDQKDSSGRTTDAITYTLDVYGQLIGRGESIYTYSGDSDTPSSTTSTLVTFAHDATGNIVLQFDGTGALTERDLWGPGINQILAQEQFSPTTAGEMPTTAGLVYWPLPNNQGSVVDLVASDGTLENHTAYTAFGAVVPPLSTKAVDSFFGAYGEETDPTTGDLVTDARIDKVSIERWTRTDPIEILAGDPNFYRDRGNDPVNGIDPTGLWFMAGTRPSGARQLAQNQALLSDIWAGVSAFPGAVASTFSDGRAWDSLQGAVTQYADDLGGMAQGALESIAAGGPALPRVHLGNYLPGPLYGHQSEFNNGRTVGSATLKAQQIAALVWGIADNVSNLFEGSGGGDGYGGSLSDEGGAADAPADPDNLASCFPAGTIVASVYGPVPIEAIKAGDEVWAYDLVASQWRACRVLETFARNYEGNSASITVADEAIEATFRHPFWVVRGDDLENRPRLDHLASVPVEATTPGRWVDACDVRVGDELLFRDGRILPVQAIRHQPFFDKVYNFKVNELECYAVGRNNVLVHNTNSGVEGTPQPEAPRPFGDLIRDAETNPADWEVTNSETTPSTNMRNRGGTSFQELLRNKNTGEEMVRHTLFGPDGSIFEPPHFRPFWN